MIPLLPSHGICKNQIQCHLKNDIENIEITPKGLIAVGRLTCVSLESQIEVNTWVTLGVNLILTLCSNAG